MQKSGDYGVLRAKWDLNIILFLPRLKGLGKGLGKGSRKITRAIGSENLQQYKHYRSIACMNSQEL